jgi:hypothetical protein
LEVLKKKAYKKMEKNIIIIAVVNDFVYYSKQGKNFQIPTEYLSEIIENLFGYEETYDTCEGDVVVSKGKELVIPSVYELNRKQLESVMQAKETEYETELNEKQLYKLGLLYDKFDYLAWQYQGKYEITELDVMISFWNLHTFLSIDEETELGKFIYKGVEIPCNYENFAKLFLQNISKKN